MVAKSVGSRASMREEIEGVVVCIKKDWRLSRTAHPAHEFTPNAIRKIGTNLPEWPPARPIVAREVLRGQMFQRIGKKTIRRDEETLRVPSIEVRLRHRTLLKMNVSRFAIFDALFFIQMRLEHLAPMPIEDLRRVILKFRG